VPVAWIVAEDPELKSVAARGQVETGPERDYTVKVDAAGLKPGQNYFYGFRVNETTSPIGSTWTARTGAQDGLEVAVVSCSNWPAGFFNAYKAIAQRPTLDLVIHLGDYIYEYAPDGYAGAIGAQIGRVSDPPKELVTLADYRRRHAQYKTDPNLQAAHARCPWIVTWDDHETANDSFFGGAENHQPELDGDWKAREQAGVQAYFEWMPIRDPVPGAARGAIWRSFDFGDLASIVMLETRLTGRAEQLDYARDITLTQDAAGRPVPDIPGFMTKLNDPARLIMPAAQEAFVAERLKESTGRGVTWQVLGNQVIMAEVRAPNFAALLPEAVKADLAQRYPNVAAQIEFTRLGLPVNLDAWDGYPAARARLLKAAADAVASLIVVTGDTHTAWANELFLDPARTTRVGVEFGATSVTSPGIADELPVPGLDFAAAFVGANPQTVKWHDPKNRGYLIVKLSKAEAVAEFYSVSTVVSPTYDTKLEARFKVRPGGIGGMGPIERA
jgi:alkaline phosphatase D